MATVQDQAAVGVVVGMKALTGQVVPRYDIDYLLVNFPDTFNLMLQAIAKMQQDPATTGFYGLAGIHGLPTDIWDNVDRVFEDQFGGYCAHGVLVFPTWHRPYLALFEQSIYLRMVEVASGYNEPHKTRYLNAAQQFRLPYLDYFRPRGGQVTFSGLPGGNGTTSFPYDFRLPDIFSAKTVTVKVAPDDAPVSNFNNPLYTYHFTPQSGQFSQSDQDSQSASFSMSQTLRYPLSKNATEHDLKTQSIALNSGREGRCSLFLSLVNSSPYPSVEDVASDSVRQQGDMTEADSVTNPTSRNPRGSGSLEGSIHGNYHNIIGGFFGNRSRPNGHMSSVQLAAFDPVFWFHHCQVDRIWALWQTMHPDAWFPSSPDPSLKPESQKDLLPFYKTRSSAGNGTYYNSDDARATEFFGYVYDDYMKTTDPNQVWTDLKNRYTWASRTPRDSGIRDPPPEMQPLPVATSQFFAPPPKPRATVMSLEGDADDDSLVSTVASSVQKIAAPVVAQAQAILQAAPNLVSNAFVPNKVDPKFDREWYVDSVVKRSAANGLFAIYFFLAKPGEITTNPDNFITSPYLAGLNHIFTSPREYCDNCGRLEAAGAFASDTIPITPLLLDYMNLPNSELHSLQPADVKPFLVKHLRWRVVYGNGGLKDPRDVPNFTLNVSAKISHDDGTRTFEEYPDVISQILGNASATATADTSG